MYKFLIQTNIPIFHYSIIPSGLHETCSTKNGVISISCTICETLIIFIKIHKFSEKKSYCRYMAHNLMSLNGISIYFSLWIQ